MAVVLVKGSNPEMGLQNCTRLWLQEDLTKAFGPVQHCRKPPTSGNPAEDVALITFVNREDAERCVDALKQGIVLGNGCEICGEFKGSGKGGGKGGKGRKGGGVDWLQKKEDSRALAGIGSRNRSRSRSRGRRDSRSRSRGRRDYRDSGRDYRERSSYQSGYNNRDRDRRDSSRGRSDSRGRGKSGRSKSRRRADSRSKSSRRSRSKSRRRKDSRRRSRSKSGTRGGGGNNSSSDGRRDVAPPPPAPPAETSADRNERFTYAIDAANQLPTVRDARARLQSVDAEIRDVLEDDLQERYHQAFEAQCNIEQMEAEIKSITEMWLEQCIQVLQ